MSSRSASVLSVASESTWTHFDASIKEKYTQTLPKRALNECLSNNR